MDTAEWTKPGGLTGIQLKTPVETLTLKKYPDYFNPALSPCLKSECGTGKKGNASIFAKVVRPGGNMRPDARLAHSDVQFKAFTSF
jgi:hypothetical protein